MKKFIVIAIIILIIVALFAPKKIFRREHHTGSKRIMSPTDFSSLSSWWTWGGQYYSSPMYKIRKSYDPECIEVPKKPIHVRNTVFQQEVVPPFPRPKQSVVC